ncbi:hypothetical protein [Agromyces aerolatus]|uniref:hypothetical protein n=1 Tax=Agromyces sp. LY-1074 TaxID=3074080 RepID=UPI002856306C|nr:MULTISPECIES: hypothetical protein [unclassified Agromyces]MDR5701546.1 hypothetical protein [Agromyces sp. LY-1074]MDR5707847.1 hypothetical protein [Agromyces sp. LY-1358]
MNRTQGRPFDPAELDRREIAEFGAPLVVVEPGEPLSLRGWSWESRNAVTISGEAAYLTIDEREIRVRTWKHLPAFSEAVAESRHLDDLRDNFGAGVALPAGSTTVTIDAIETPAERIVAQPYMLTVCRLHEVTVTITTPATSAMPRLVTRSPS